jgi:rhodanese-related sulfurtransferase
VLIKKLIFNLFLFFLLLPVAGCGEANAPAQSTATNIFSLPKNGDGYIDISVDQLETALADKDFTLVNVHIPYEGELPQTDAFIPYNEVEANLDQFPADKDGRIVLYCRSGRMSTDTAQVLVNLGYTNVVEVDGGMQAWQAAGNEIISK